MAITLYDGVYRPRNNGVASPSANGVSSALPIIPLGYSFLRDNLGNYIKDNNGAYIIVKTEPISSMVASNRNRIPYTYANTGSTNFMKFYGVPVYAPSDTDITIEKVIFDNFYAMPSGGILTSGLIPFYLYAAIEYPIGGTIYPLYENGLSKVDMVLGKRANMSPLSPLVITKGTSYRIRYQQEHYTAGGATYNQLHNTLLAPSRDLAQSGADNTVNKAHSGTISAVVSPTLAYGFTSIIGKPAGYNFKSFFIVSDSIGRGVGDSTGTTAQGDWLSGTSPTAPYYNYGNMGWIERYLGIDHPYYSMAVQARVVQSSVFTLANLAEQFAVMSSAPPTHVFLALGLNDLMAARTPANVLADIDSAIALIKSQLGNDIIVIVPTITPITQSSDGWTTTANQTFSGSLGGTNPHWANFSDASGATGRLKLNADLKAGLSTADIVLDIASVVQDSVTPTKMRVDLGAPSLDGIHLKDIIVQQIIAYTNANLVI